MKHKGNFAASQKPRRLTAEARREQLLACALAVFARRGLGEARHAEVAREAGMSVPTVFNYFPTREALVLAVLDEVGRFILDEVLRPIQRDERPAPEVLRDSALAFAAAIETHPDHARVWLDWSTAVRDDIWPLIWNPGSGLRAVRRYRARKQSLKQLD